MPIQFPEIRNLSFGEANPYLSGMQSGQNIFNNILSQQKLMAELPYAGQLAKSTAAYKIAMANYLNNPYQLQRFMTPLGKTLNEQRMNQGDINNNIGNIPQGSQTGVKQEQMLNNTSSENDSDPYGLEVQKMTTDAQARNRNLFATNMEKTIGFINPDDLTQYSGVGGKLKLSKDTIASAVGHPPENYKNYLKSLEAATFLAKQVRQFYGASIRPEVELSLNKMTNPSFWSTDPKTAKELFNQNVDLLYKELGTYRQALRTPKAYQEQNIESKSNKNSNGNIENISKILKKEGQNFKNIKVKMKSPEGKVYLVPQGNTQIFLDNGYKRAY